MRFASLGSGSRGNGTLIESGATCLLIDLGFSLSDTIARLQRLGREPSCVDALLVTHEHADHISGVLAFARRFDKPVFMTAGTRYAATGSMTPDCSGLLPGPDVRTFSCHRNFSIGDIEVQPVPVPHDAREPCQFVFRAAGHSLGILTDIGHLTSHVLGCYRQLDALMLECNYDRRMLAEGPYPYRLKQRVAGERGHLSNAQAAELVSAMQSDCLQHLVVSHISEKNNLPALAQDAVGQALGLWHGCLSLAAQETGLAWIDLD